MTNKQDDVEHTGDSRKAALLAMRLVGQVLDEAYIIANAAIESGQPWRQMSILKNFKSSKINDTDEQDGCSVTSKCDVNENKMEHGANIVATSTPQKDAEESRNSRPNSAYIGQGDEDLEMQQNGLIKSTSMFLNHLFDMSDVETVVVCDDNDLVRDNTEPRNLLTQAMSKIMESYINTALYIAHDQNIEMDDTEVPNDTSSSEYSDYSFLEDAFAADASKDISFYVHDDASERNNMKSPNAIESAEIKEVNDIRPESSSEKNEVARYEHAYLTMNRDFDQYYEDDEDPVLRDPKGMTLHEVELLTANTSDDNVSRYSDIEKQKKCSDLSKNDIERASFAFSIYDFDGSGKIDAYNVGDVLRALNSNPTLATIEKLGGTKKKGEKMLTIEEFLPIYSQAKKDKDQGQYEDFLECLKLYDKNENGLMLGAELTHTLLALGEKLDDDEVAEVTKDCMDPEDDDGMIPYASFLKKVLA